MINMFFFIAWGALFMPAFILTSIVGRPLARSLCAVGLVLDPSSRRTGQCAALLQYHRGAGCLAGHHLAGIRFVARRLQDFKVIQRAGWPPFLLLFFSLTIPRGWRTLSISGGQENRDVGWANRPSKPY